MVGIRPACDLEMAAAATSSDPLPPPRTERTGPRRALLDPSAGGGTTDVAAALSGSRFRGSNENPLSFFNCLLGRICGWFLLVNVGFRRETRAVWAVTSTWLSESRKAIAT